MIAPSLSLRASLLNIASWFTTEPENNVAWSGILVERHPVAGVLLIARRARLGICLRDRTGAMFGERDSAVIALPDSFLRLAGDASHDARIEVDNGLAKVRGRDDLKAGVVSILDPYGDWRADFPDPSDYIRRECFDGEADDYRLLLKTCTALYLASGEDARSARRARFRIRHARGGLQEVSFPKFKDALVFVKGSEHEPNPRSNVIPFEAASAA